MAGVTVNLSGAASMTTTTDSNGEYQFGTLANTLSAGIYTVTPSKSGYSFTSASNNITIVTGRLGDLGEVPFPANGVDFEAVAETDEKII